MIKYNKRERTVSLLEKRGWLTITEKDWRYYGIDGYWQALWGGKIKFLWKGNWCYFV